MRNGCDLNKKRLHVANQNYMSALHKIQSSSSELRLRQDKQHINFEQFLLSRLLVYCLTQQS